MRISFYSFKFIHVECLPQRFALELTHCKPKCITEKNGSEDRREEKNCWKTLNGIEFCVKKMT